jgi:hypothetical protein
MCQSVCEKVRQDGIAEVAAQVPGTRTVGVQVAIGKDIGHGIAHGQLIILVGVFKLIDIFAAEQIEQVGFLGRMLVTDGIGGC